jgi:hypothetical protein
VRRAQLPIILILREPIDGRQELVVSNDTRLDSSVRFEIRDADSDDILLDGSVIAIRDAVTTVGSIQAPPDQRLLMLSWGSDDSGAQRSHYLAGPRPFDLERYRSWIERAYPTVEAASR